MGSKNNLYDEYERISVWISRYLDTMQSMDHDPFVEGKPRNDKYEKWRESVVKTIPAPKNQR